MHAIMLWLALAAAPFWETKAPSEWSEEQLRILFTQSPWAQATDGGGPVVILATARPIQDAERELWRRRRAKGAPPLDLEYEDFIANDQGRHIVLAIAYPDPRPLSNADEAKQMEKDSILKIGKKKYKMTGQFPPTPADPYLRLVYPREVGPNDKSLVFELYLPGASGYHIAEFRMKELLYHGKPEM
jgi:hypothetical protein